MHERMTDKTTQPSDADMINVIGPPIADAWTSLRCFLMETYDIVPTFNSGGQRYGWNFSTVSAGGHYAKCIPKKVHLQPW